MLLSVIVPVYNAEKFLRKCIDSIKSQTYKNIEIIVVNDASTGNVIEMVDDFNNKGYCIKLVNHEKNKGLFAARLSGYNAANGEYIAFIDADDYVSVDFYRTLLQKAIEVEADMVISDAVNEYTDGTREYYNLDNILNTDILLEGSTAFDMFMKQNGKFYLFWTMWNKIYKKSLFEKCLPFFNKIKDKGISGSEDIAFGCVFWSHAIRVANVHNVYYYYMRHNEQWTASVDSLKYKKHLDDTFIAFEFFESVLKDTGNYEKHKDDFRKFKLTHISTFFNLIKNYNLNIDVLNLFGCKKEELNHDENYFYKLTTQFNSKFDGLENTKKFIASDSCKIVSFDIFDTLILRPFLEPSDLFSLLDDDYRNLEQISGYVNFGSIRKEAESKFRTKLWHLNPSHEDLTIDEIYQEIFSGYKIREETLTTLKQKEIDLEVQFCKARKSAKELYDLAVYCGKKIICISDMYLPKDVLFTMLKKCGYSGVSEIYVSSEIRLTKWNGKLYKHVLKELGVKSNTVIHIGDSYESDITQASNSGMNVQHLQKTSELLYNNNLFNCIFNPHLKKDNVFATGRATEFLGIRCMLATVANKFFDNPLVNIHDASDFNSNPYWVGYYALGMHLYSVADWLLDNTKKEFDTVHFIARDGYLPKMAFDIIKDKDSPKSNYFYASRAALLPLNLNKASDMNMLLERINVDETSITPLKLVEAIAPILKKTNDIIAFFDENNIQADRRISDNSMLSIVVKLIADNLYDESAAQGYSKKIKTELSKIIKNNDCTFDIGYSGRVDEVLSETLGYTINSFYLHTNKDAANKRWKKYECVNKCFFDYTPIVFGTMREQLFMKLEPSCVGYEINGDEINFSFSESTPSYPEEFVMNLIHKGALDFVNEFHSTFYECGQIFYRRTDASLPLDYYLNHSKPFDRYMFNNVAFEDGLGSFINIHEHWSYLTLESQRGDILTPFQNDGIDIRVIKLINKFFPKGGRRRALLKRIGKKFFN